MPRAEASDEISAMGWMVPTSLFACMIVIRMVRSVMACSTSLTLTMPLESTGSRVTSKPQCSRRAQTSSTAGCSIWEVMMWLPRDLSAEATPLMAWLFDSVAQPVKTISEGRQFRSAATCPRARFTARLGSIPKRCPLEGLPNSKVMNSRIASATAGSSGVVAL